MFKFMLEVCAVILELFAWISPNSPATGGWGGGGVLWTYST